MKYRVVYASVGVLSGHLPGEEVEIADQQDAAHLLGLGVIEKIKAASKPDPDAAKAKAEAEAKAAEAKAKAEAKKKADAEAKAKAAKPAPAKAESQPAQEGTDAAGQPASSK